MLGLFARKIGRLIFLCHFHFDVGFHFRELFQGVLVAFIGVIPQHGANRVGVVIDGDGRGRIVVAPNWPRISCELSSV